MKVLLLLLGYMVFFLAGWGLCAYLSAREIDRLRDLAEGRRVKWLDAVKAREIR